MQATQSSESWRRMWTVYHDAVDRPIDQRASFVEAATSDDPEVRSEVLSLLESHDVASAGFLDRPALRPAIPDEPVRSLPTLTGRRLGRYLVGRLIAEGGTAAVYQAQQFDPPKMVALKVIRRGIGDHRAARRFEAEAAVLARLDHPGVAQVFEAGSFDLGEGGQPYFAMELIRGVRITDFATSHRLDVADRVRLIIDACDAVHHANMRGVIHRDLKPSNVLVQEAADGKPACVKVLDFGVAQLTEADVDATRATAVAEVAGTLPYMSPEQAAGDARRIDARSDVYALGVTCFELLCGRLPLPFESASLFDAIRVIREGDPLRLGSVDPQLRGDLETIVHKAIARDPTERYESADALAADLRRWLSNRPILARPATRAYLFRKFVQRNKGIVAAITAAGAALIIGASVATWQAIEARHAANLASARADNARALAANVLDQLQTIIGELPRTTAVRAQLLEDTAGFLDDISNQFNDDPAILLLAARAHFELGLAMGTIRGASLNDPHAALVELDRALACLAKIDPLAPEHAQARTTEPYVRMRMTDTLRAVGRTDEAIQCGLRAGDLFGQLAGDRAGMYSVESVGQYRLVSEIARLADQPDVIRDADARSRRVLHDLRDPPPADPLERLNLARTRAEYGRQQLESGVWEAGVALASLHQAEADIDRAANDGADATTVRPFAIDVTRSIQGLLYGEGRCAEATVIAERCVRLCREELAELPQRQSVRAMMLNVLNQQASCESTLGHDDRAIALARQALAESDVLREFEPDADVYKSMELRSGLNLLDALVTAVERTPPESTRRTTLRQEAGVVLDDMNTLAQQVLIRSAAATMPMLAGTPTIIDKELASLKARWDALMLDRPVRAGE